MRTTQILIAGFSLALALAGCTRNTIIVIAPGSPNGIASVNCWRPEDKQQGYLSPHEVLQIVIKAPDIAQARHVSGCAAVKFQLTKDGKARNMTILRDMPAGYGYGAAVARQIGEETFEPPSSPNAWYYRAVSITITPLVAPPGGFTRPGVPAPPPAQPR